MEINKVFSERLRKLREARGFSQEAVADEIGIERQTLGNYEKGKRKPDIEVLSKIKAFFAVDYEYLLGETNCQTKAKQEELKSDLLFSLSLLPQETQTCIVRSLDKISMAISTIEVSGEEAECGRIFEALLSFIASAMRQYSKAREEAEQLADTLERCGDIPIDKMQLLEIQAHKFYVNSMRNKEAAAAAMSQFIDKMQGALYSDVMRLFEKEV